MPTLKTITYRSVLAILFACNDVSAFCPSPSNTGVKVDVSEDTSALSRRSFVDQVAIAALGLGTLPIARANASGGATAGGAYLLSAKQRYNSRVTAGIKGFLELGTSLESGDLSAAKAYLTSVETGSWDDLKSAGYLLANAFRRSSSTAPDKLPSVKKWKAFAGKVGALATSLSKKDAKGAYAAYQEAGAALQEYLVEVELPPASEILKS